MASTKSRPRKTLEDFMALPDDVRAELIDGELYVTPAPFRRHQEAIENLFLVLAPQVRSLELGRLHLSPLDVHLPTGDVVEPDLIFVSRANDAIRQDWIRGAPDLLIEVVSTSQPERDRIVKRALYARNDVGAFWIVDPEEGAIEVLRLEAGAYRPEAYFRGDADLTTPALPGVEVQLAEIFE